MGLLSYTDIESNSFEFLTEIFKRCDETNTTQLLGNLLNIFSQGKLRFPSDLRPSGNLNLLAGAEVVEVEKDDYIED